MLHYLLPADRRGGETLCRRRRRITFPHAVNGYWIANPAVPEDAICYSEDYILGLYGSLGLDAGRLGALRLLERPAEAVQRPGRGVRDQIARARPPAVLRLKRMVRRLRDRWRARGWRHGLVGEAGNLVDRARKHAAAA